MHKSVHIKNKIREGVCTGWNGQDEGGVWVGQWYLYTMFSDRHRRTVSKFPNSASLQGANLPKVIASEDNPSLDTFVWHVQDSGYDGAGILHPLRHNALHCIGKPISYDVDEDVEDLFVETHSTRFSCAL